MFTPILTDSQFNLECVEFLNNQFKNKSTKLLAKVGNSADLLLLGASCLEVDFTLAYSVINITIFKEEKVYCHLRCTQPSPGVGEVALTPSEDMLKVNKDTFKLVRSVRELLYKKPWIRAHRLQAWAEYDQDKNLKFLEHLGLKREATLRKASPKGKDVEMYSLIKEDTLSGEQLA